MTADDVQRVQRAGAVAAQLGTAFLLAEEAGSSPVHRAALTGRSSPKPLSPNRFRDGTREDCEIGSSMTTRRSRRSGIPEIHYLTSPLRAASVRAGDPQAVNVWAGTGFREARPGTVAEIMRNLG